jgi:hypothetical protein
MGQRQTDRQTDRQASTQMKDYERDGQELKNALRQLKI